MQDGSQKSRKKKIARTKRDFSPSQALEHERVRRELAANGYTWETYNRGNYRDPNVTVMTPAAPANQGPVLTGQTPTTSSLDATAPGQDPLTPGSSKPPEPRERPKHLGHISIPYCKEISAKREYIHNIHKRFH
jgi:hypothetical protein